MFQVQVKIWYLIHKKNRKQTRRTLWQPSKMVPSDPHFLVFIPLCNPLPLKVCWTYEFTSVSRTVHKIMECHFQDEFTKRLWILFGYPLSSALGEASHHVANCPMERPMWQEIGVPNQQPARTRVLPAATGVSLEMRSLPLEPWDGCCPTDTSIAALCVTRRRAEKCSQIPDPQKLWDNQYISF